MCAGDDPARGEQPGRDGPSRRRAPPAAARTPPDGGPAAAAPETYSELVVIDEATRVTWPRRREPRLATPEPIDLEVIAWLADVRVGLATQLHRRFYGERSYSTTQRRVRRMTQAGWVQRFQFREDGASSALVYLVTDAGLAAAKDAIGPRGAYLNPRREWSAPSTEDPALRRARHDLHVSAWVMAVETLLGDAVRGVRGPRGSQVAPPARTIAGEHIAYGATDLKLPGGRVAVPGARAHVLRRRARRPRGTARRRRAP